MWRTYIRKTENWQEKQPREWTKDSGNNAAKTGRTSRFQTDTPILCQKYRARGNSIQPNCSPVPTELTTLKKVSIWTCWSYFAPVLIRAGIAHSLSTFTHSMKPSSLALRLCAHQTHIRARTRHDCAVSEMNSWIIGAQTSPKLVARREEKGQN